MKISILGSVLAGAAMVLGGQSAMAASATELSGAANARLQQLYAAVPAAKALGQKAHAVLVFPKVTKAGLGVGGQYGEGALLQKGKAVAYYSTGGASIGLQAGAQQYVTRCSS